MIEYLEKLLDGRENEKALAYAEQMLRDSRSTPLEMLAAQVGLLKVRCWLNQDDQAIGPGCVAIRMASELEEWDYHGLACLFLGGVYQKLRKHREAIDVLHQYFGHFHLYGTARSYQANAWYNLGLLYAASQNHKQAMQAFMKALEITEAAGWHRFAHGIRQALVEQYIRNGDVGQVPLLLAKSGHYLRHHPNELDATQSRLFHLKLRAEFAMSTKRLDRAHAVALRGLSESAKRLEHLCYFHMVLANIARQKGRPVEALGHASAAKVYASKDHRYDLESEATNLCYEVMKSNPGALAELDRHYLSVG